MKRRRVLHITTVPMSLTFLRGQAAFMRERGVDLMAVSSPGPDLEAFRDSEGVPVASVEMPRQITPVRDAVAVFRLRKTISAISPDVVHAHTPKGGLLGLIAATLARVPVRIYHMRGLPMLTARGPRRILLRATEWVSCRLAHRVVCVSHSLREVAVAHGLCPAEKIEVLLGGSGNGVDAAGRFNPDLVAAEARGQTRARFGIPDDALVVGFVGRLVKDKGIVELAEAWQSLRERHPTAHLLLVGPPETRDPVPEHVETALRSDARVHFAGMDWDTPPLYAAMDVVTLPSHREGFPNVALEAAAMGLPVVATRIPGCMDAVADGHTGTLVRPGRSDALAEALSAYLASEALREQRGRAGRERACREFRQDALWAALHDRYRMLLESRPTPISRSAAAQRRYETAKRILDVIASTSAILVLSPVIAFVALLVRWKLGTPVLFRQVRPGRHGRPFTLYKFRTMTNRLDAAGAPLPDAERLTPLGRFLRASSLDELPELWNVLRGEMSIVGPRPLLMEYLPLYSAEQARRHEVRPGLTGWAQVRGRNALGWSERLALDTWYVTRRSLLLDLQIIAWTVGKVLARDGICHPGHATMERFRGSAG